jgi:tetratricopeptide (TPR) repeat protein
MTRSRSRPAALALVSIAILAGCVSLDGLPRSMSSKNRATVYEGIHVHQRAVELYEQGQFAEAVAVGTKAVELLERALGPDHLYVTIPVRSLAVFLQTQGAYAEAEPLYARVVAIQEKAPRPKPGTSDEVHFPDRNMSLERSLDELAALYMQWGAYAKAEPLYARTLAIRQRRLRPTHPELVESLNNLALAFEKQGAYARAEELYTSALALAEKVLGPKHRDVARSLNGLATVYWNEGTYARAEPLMVRALKIREDLLAEVHQFGPKNLGSLPNTYTQPSASSSSSSSRPWTKSNPKPKPKPKSNPAANLGVGLALNVYKHVIEAANTRTLQSISNLDQLYSAVGVYAKAEPLVTRTADVFETVLEAVRSDVSESLDGLARFYVTTGEYKRAEPLLVRTLEAHERLLGGTHPDLLNSLNNLAQLYQTQGAYAQAEPLLLRAIGIQEKTLGRDHPDVARSLNNLAALYRMQGEHAKAEPLLLRSVDVLERKLGQMHLDVARSLNNLAALYHDQGALPKAEPLYLRAVDIMSKAPGGTHPDAVRYLNNLGVLYHASGKPRRAELLMARAAELREAQLQPEMARLSAPRKRSLVKLLQQETEALVSLHADSTPTSAAAFGLALTTVLRRKGLALDSLLHNQATLRAHLTPEIRTKLDRLTVAHTELSVRLRARVDPRRAAAQAAAIAELRTRIDGLESELAAASTALPAESRSITPAKIQSALPYGAALIELVRYRRFDPRRGRQRWQEPRYVAYILKRQGPPQWISLGEAAPIDAAVDAVLAQMKRGAGTDATRAVLQRLDALVIGPLRDRLVGVSHLIVSPDSKLNLVPFEALLDPDGRYELEHRLVSYVTSARDLLPHGLRRAPRSPATIVAAPDYGPGRSFVPLDGASAEAAEVAAHFAGARTLTGGGATKAALAAVVGPPVLHVATHGFFAHDPVARPTPAAAAPDPEERDMFIEGVLAGGGGGGGGGGGERCSAGASCRRPHRRRPRIRPRRSIAPVSRSRTPTSAPTASSPRARSRAMTGGAHSSWCSRRARPAWARCRPARGCTASATRSRWRAPNRRS